MSTPVTIAEINAMTRDEALALLGPCVAIPSWAEAVVDGRPYADVAAAVAVGEAAAARWTGADVDTALADHPRIGERHRGLGASAAMSRGEQSGVDRDDDALRARLADGNRRYEQRFDRIYLVRAAGRSAEEMLDLLEQRLAHDPATEAEVTRGQLAEIALLRLRGLLTDEPRRQAGEPVEDEP